MQFYENYVRLCNSVGKKPTAVAVDLGISRATASRWGNGIIPSYPNLVKIADYFNVTVDELLGKSEEITERTPNAADELAGIEAALEALRDQPGRRALLSATKNMTEAQVLRFADWLADITGGDKY